MNLFDKKEGLFFDKWEEYDLVEKEPILRQKLSDYIEYAKKFPFYNQKLFKVNLDSEFPLENIPPLTSDVIKPVVSSFSKSLLGKESFSVFQSGGTTGSPKVSLFSNEELEALSLPNARGFFASGLTKEDRVANLWASGSLYMTFIHINRMLQQYGCINFPFANHSQSEFIYECIRKFKINCLTGVSSYLLQLIRDFEKFGGLHIDKIFYGAEHLYEENRREIENRTGAKIIKAPGYGTIDTWYIGYQCSFCDNGVFHVHDDQVYLEIVNEENGKIINSSEIGAIYVTTYLRRLTPIIRYRIGDRGYWIKDECKCGRKTPLFKLLGRCDDVLRIGCDSVYYEDIQKCTKGIDELTGLVQIEKRRREGKDELVIRAEAQNIDNASIVKELEKRILFSRQLLREMIEKKSVSPLKIELVPPGSLPKNQRTGKLIRVIQNDV